MRKISSIVLVTLVVVGMLAACGPTPTPETVIVKETVPVTVKETVVVKETVAVKPSVVIEFWTTDNEEERVQVYEAVAAAYMAAHPNVDIRIVPID